MDAIDQKILQLLQENAKQNTKEIAQQVGLTISPTFERIKKLEQQGIIRAYVALLDEKKIDRPIMAYCQVSLFKHSKALLESFKAAIADIPEIMECLHVSGNYDFLLKVSVNNIDDYQRFAVDKLSAIEGISNIQTSFVMEALKRTTAFPL